MSEINFLNVNNSESRQYDTEKANGPSVKDLLHKIDNNLTSNQFYRDKILSKIVVKELKNGSEVIGDVNGPIISNITFKPENDTLSAMAYIAGNLLKKLWYMENENSEESIETENIKHQRIADLIDLFKEPLTIQQEMFLKSALERLSDVISEHKKMENFNIENLSLCDAITEANMNLENKIKDKRNCSEPRKESLSQNSNRKMIYVLELINKLNNVQNNLESVNFKEYKKNKSNSSEIYKNDANKSGNSFNKILEKVINLLLPNKNYNHRKIHKKLKQYINANNEKIYPKLNNIFNINKDTLSMSIKDRMLMDFLNLIEEKPDCLLSKILHRKAFEVPASNIQGNILLNLSEFYKIKSYADLIKILNSANNTINNVTDNKRRNDDTNNKVNETESITLNSKIDQNNTKNVKEKLKEHLKALINDLEYLRSNQDSTSKEDYDVSEIMPCLYNLLRSDQEFVDNKNEKLTPIERVRKTFSDIKLETKYLHHSRRIGDNEDDSNNIKAIQIWNRIINNLDRESKRNNSRRQFNLSNKNFKNARQILQIIQKFNDTNEYNLVNNIEPTEKNMLLKTMLLDLKRYIDILSNIQELLTKHTIEKAQKRLVKEFLDKIKNNILKIMKVLKTLKVMNNLQQQNKFEQIDRLQFNNIYGQIPTNYLENLQKDYIKTSFNNIMEQNNQQNTNILSELMKQRVHLLLNNMERNGDSLTNNLKYNIGKRILWNLETGNNALAKELYKIMISENTNQNLQDEIKSSFTGKIYINIIHSTVKNY